MTPNPRLVRFAPTIPVTDIERSVAFYETALGMAKVFENGRPTQFAILDHDGVELHLALESGHTARPENVCHLLVDDAGELFDRVLDAGAEIVSPLRDADYGMRTFVFADPDGNRIDVGSYLIDGVG